MSSVHWEDCSGIRLEAHGSRDSPLIGLDFKTYRCVSQVKSTLPLCRGPACSNGSNPLTGTESSFASKLQLLRNKSFSSSATGVNKEKKKRDSKKKQDRPKGM